MTLNCAFQSWGVSSPDEVLGVVFGCQLPPHNSIIVHWLFLICCGRCLEVRFLWLKHHFQSHNFCGTALIDAPFATPHAWNATHCPQKQKYVNESIFSCLFVSNHTKVCQKNLVSLQYMVSLIIRTVLSQKYKRQNTMKIRKFVFLLQKKVIPKNLEVPLDTLNTVKQHSNHNLLEPRCLARSLGTKRRSPKAS